MLFKTNLFITIHWSLFMFIEAIRCYIIIFSLWKNDENNVAAFELYILLMQDQTQEGNCPSSQYQSKVGPVAHHNPTMKWLFWGNIGPYRKGTTIFWYLYCMERRNSFWGFFLQCKHTYFMVQFGYFRKANNKNFKFLSDNQTYYKWYCISICWKC